MLVLSRKIGEVIVIDGTIRIQVTEIGNGRVKIGIEAPRNVHIARSELLEEPTNVSSSSATKEDDLHEILQSRGRSVEALKPR